MTPGAIPVLEFVTCFHFGGTERQFLNLLEGLHAPQWRPHVACFRAQGALRDELPGGLPLFELPMPSLASAAAARQLVALARYLRRQRIAVVHTTGVYPNLFGIAAARLAGTPVVVASVRDMGHMWSPRLTRAQRLACRFADAVVANSDAVAARLRDEGYAPERIAVIKNGIAAASGPVPRRRPGLRRELGIPEEAPLIGMVCRFHPLKRIEDFVDAAAVVRASHPEARFLVVGGTPAGTSDEYARALQRRADAAGLGEALCFAGPRTDVADLFAEMVVSVQSSATEGLSNTVLESMAAAVPVVATAVGGTAELIDDGVTGLLVPPSDPAALAAAIGGLLDRPREAAAMGRAARARVEAAFTCERMIRETQQLYLRLLDRAPRAMAGRVPVRRMA